MNIRCSVVVGCLIVTASNLHGRPAATYRPGGRVLVDAHNAYPEDGRHLDRISRALGTGVPIAIEQDLAWCQTANGTFDVVVAHDTTCRGNEPTLRQYFFDVVKPIVEPALTHGQKGEWPIITLNLDFKMDPPELHRAVWRLLDEYRAWLTTAPRTATPAALAPIDVGPILVLTGQADAQEVSFHDEVPVGDRLRLFGAVHDAPAPPGAAADGTPRPMPAHQLSALVESSVESRRTRGPARGQHVDVGRPGTARDDRHGGAPGRPVDPVLYAERRGGERRRRTRLVAGLQLWLCRGRGNPVAGRARYRCGLHRDRSVRTAGRRPAHTASATVIHRHRLPVC
jgi:hypothetical protein